MSTPNQVAKRQSRAQQLSASQAAGHRRIEEHEYEASASAQAGLSLNIFSALSGVFSGKKKTVTDTAADGTSHSVSSSHSDGHWKSAGHTKMDVTQSATTTSRHRHRVIEEGVQQQKQTQTQQKITPVDHLGIEGGKN